MGHSTVGMVLDSKITKSTFSPPSELICHPHGHNPIPQDPCPSQPIALLSTCYPFVGEWLGADPLPTRRLGDRKSTRLNSSHQIISYAVFCLKKKKKNDPRPARWCCHTRKPRVLLNSV